MPFRIIQQNRARPLIAATRIAARDDVYNSIFAMPDGWSGPIPIRRSWAWLREWEACYVITMPFVTSFFTSRSSPLSDYLPTADLATVASWSVADPYHDA